MLTISKYNLKQALFFLIVSLGFFVRVFDVVRTQGLYGDMGRDLLVAKHLAEEKNPPVVRPFTQGGQGRLQNSPVYFYVLKTAFQVVRKPELVVYLFVLTGAGSIFLAYQIGKCISNSTLGLLSAFTTAFSMQLIGMSRAVWQPHLLPFLTLLAFFLLVKAWKKQAPVLLYLSFLIGMFALTIHFSFAPLFLGFNVVFSLTFLFWIAQKRYQVIFFLCLYIFSLGVFGLKLIGVKNLQGSTSFFALNVQHIDKALDLVLSIFRFGIFGNFPPSSDWLILIALLLGCIGFGLFLWKSWQKKDVFAGFSLLFLGSTSFCLVFFTQALALQYIIPYMALLPLFLGMALYGYYQLHQTVFLLLGGALGLVLISSFMNVGYFFPQVPGDWEYQQTVADQIVSDFMSRENNPRLSPETFSAVILDTNNTGRDETKFNNCLECITSPLNLLLEEKVGGPLVSLSSTENSYTNLSSNNQNPKYYYFICHLQATQSAHTPQTSLALATEHCLPLFYQHLPQDGWALLGQKTVLFGNDYGSVVFFVLGKNSSRVK